MTIPFHLLISVAPQSVDTARRTQPCRLKLCVIHKFSRSLNIHEKQRCDAVLSSSLFLSFGVLRLSLPPIVILIIHSLLVLHSLDLPSIHLHSDRGKFHRLDSMVFTVSYSSLYMLSLLLHFLFGIQTFFL